MSRVESLLSARLFVAPQLAGDKLFFVSNLSGHLSLYAMDLGGSVPEPLLPPDIALQNPMLLGGAPFAVFPDLDRVIVMIDADGDENYQPMAIPMTGGYPEPAFGDAFDDWRVHMSNVERDKHTVHLTAASRSDPLFVTHRAHVATAKLDRIGESEYGGFTLGENDEQSLTVVADAFGAGDHVLYLKRGDAERAVLFGTPQSERGPDFEPTPNSIGNCFFVNGDEALLFTTSLFEDTYGLATMTLAAAEPAPVTVEGTVHEGFGELSELDHLAGDRYLVGYNIDGCDWLYEGTYDAADKRMRLDHVLVGRGELSGGVLKGHHYDKATDRHVLSFTTATRPPQIYTLAGPDRSDRRQHTRERVLGIPEHWLSPGEDASFTSYDDLRVSARLYLPPADLGFEGPRPVVHYVHGGPQSQEHPDFAWFSMPLIQLLAMRGFAVFVPNVRGSTGYGFDYMSRVVKDWGGADRLDHVHAITDVLPADPRVDASRAAVVGRSYGGYMTLTLAGRHPELWSAAIDMFGPYDLPVWAGRLPETWKPFMKFLIGDPEEDHEFLIERSPSTYIDNLACPLLVIQGKNDPRVREDESADVVAALRAQGKDVDYLVFDDEGHDVLKYENRVTCYNAMVEFLTTHLQP